ncbi:MAG: hypothetical protein LDLANPLL_00250 [Turneriella sp.]|nr:hypothetical protein [Turneriella sp.]
MSARLDGIEKKIAALEVQIQSLRTEFEEAKRGEKIESEPPTKDVSTPQKIAAQTSTSASSWEWLVGGNIIGKLGVVTLILSVAFFMIYAIDRGWLGEWVRLLILQLTFALLSFLSYSLYKKKYKYVPEILSIVAIGINTIAVYSAHFLYHYIGSIETMVMMVSLMLLSLAFARRIGAHALAMLLFVGFFILPVIHSHEINEPFTYFGYLLAVNFLYFFIGHKTVTESKTLISPHTFWIVLFGNAFSLFAWTGGFKTYSIAALIFSAGSLVLILFRAHIARWSESSANADFFWKCATILTANLVYMAMVEAILSLLPEPSSEVLAITFACQAALNYITLQILPHSARFLPAASASIVLLLTLGIMQVSDDFEERFLLAIFLSAAMFMSTKWADRFLYYFSLVLFLFNLIALLFSTSITDGAYFVLNWQMACLTFCTASSVLLLIKTQWRDGFIRVSHIASALLASFVAVIAEMERIFTSTDARLLIVTLVLASYSLLFLYIGFKWHKNWFRKAGLAFMGLAITKFYFVDIWYWDKSVRIVAGIVLGGGLVLISFYYEKFKDKLKGVVLILLFIGVFSPKNMLGAVAKDSSTVTVTATEALPSGEKASIDKKAVEEKSAIASRVNTEHKKSVWLFRVIFWLLLVLVGWGAFRIHKEKN